MPARSLIIFIMLYRRMRRVFFPFILTVAAAQVAAAQSFDLTSSLPSGQPVGTTIVWTATPSLGTQYQFSVTDSTGTFFIASDFSPYNTFSWTSIDQGIYSVRAIAQPPSGASQQVTKGFLVLSRVSGSSAVVTPTSNPLVALYSAPACGQGSIHVEYTLNGANNWKPTNTKACVSNKSSNFYIAGMLPSTIYQMRNVVVNGSQTTTSAVTLFTTGALPRSFPTFQLTNPPDLNSSLTQQVLVHSMLDLSHFSDSIPIATDVFGRIIWYYDYRVTNPAVLGYVTRMIPGGTMLMQSSFGATRGQYFVGEIDLAGNVLRQTNLARINAQLAALGREQLR